LGILRIEVVHLKLSDLRKPQANSNGQQTSALDSHRCCE
jgi:hypothetical protein